jgi:hypothetical protein
VSFLICFSIIGLYCCSAIPGFYRLEPSAAHCS